MYLAWGILCFWLAGALLWVASHGVPEGSSGAADVWGLILRGVRGEHL